MYEKGSQTPARRGERERAGGRSRSLRRAARFKPAANRFELRPGSQSLEIGIGTQRGAVTIAFVDSAFDPGQSFIFAACARLGAGNVIRDIRLLISLEGLPSRFG